MQTSSSRSGKGSECDKDNMATQSPSKLDDEILVCSICLETLKEPKILGCLHRYCKQCLADVIAKSPDAGTYKCPTCREEYGVPDGGIESIKGDFLLEAVLENRKLERDLKDKQKKQLCSSCDKNTTMVAICPDCGGFICKDCHSCHEVMKTFKSHHHVVTLEDIESGKVTFNAQNITSTLKAPKCSVHKDMILHINCQTCDKLICPVCAPIHHNSHKLEEIASASERIKGRVQELVENVVMAENTLEARMQEFRKIGQAKLDIVLRTNEQLHETADTEEQKVRHAGQAALRKLEEKKKMIEKKTDQNVRNIRQEEAFLANEIKMLEKFCTQTSKQMEDQAEENMKRMRNTQMTAQFLTKDVDNWSVLLAAPDLQHNLQVSSEDATNNLFEKALESLTTLAVNFRNLTISPLESECWKEKWSLDLSEKDSKWFKADHTKQNCDMKFMEGTAQLVTIALRHTDICVSAFDIKTKSISHLQHYHFSESKGVPQNIGIAGMQNNLIYSTAKRPESQASELVHKTLDGGFFVCTFALNVVNPAVSCIAQCKKKNDLIVGLCGSTMLHRCNFEANGFSSFQVNVDSFHSPVSIDSTKEDNALLCDGVTKAIAVNGEGNLICHFSGRHLSDQPLVISEDRSGFVYVLWGVKDEEGSKGGVDEAAKNEILLTSTNVVRQYSPSGAFISEFIVGNAVTMMTTVVTDDDQDAVTVGTPEGLIQCYSMTPFGRTWSNFIREQGIE